MARVLLVLGAEASGTRLVTRLLINAGALGDGGHDQRWDTEALPAPRCNLAWRRSLPHKKSWPELDALADKAAEAGYDLAAVVVVREPTATKASQVRAGHVPDETVAWRHIQRAYLTAFDFIWDHDLPYYLISYEAIIFHPEPAIAGLLDWAGLSLNGWESIYIYDGNVKYYEQHAWARVASDNADTEKGIGAG